MAGMRRDLLAVGAGAVLWAVLWVGGAQLVSAVYPALLPAGAPVTHTGMLLGLIGYSVVLSAAAGYVTAALSAGSGGRAVRILAGLQLLLGISFEVSAWSLTPVWYHFVFLVLLVPSILYGGHVRGDRGRDMQGVRA
jgi:hypothetical protein